jgi:hypothetical protein
MADLAISYKLTVDVQIEAGIHTLKVDIDTLFRQGLGVYLKGTLVQAAGVVRGNVRGIYGKRISDVGIMRNVIASAHGNLPAHGDVQPISLTKGPISVGEIRYHIYGRIVGKGPFTAKTNETVTQRAIAGIRNSGTLIRDKICTRLFTSDMQILQGLVRLQIQHHVYS